MKKILPILFIVLCVGQSYAQKIKGLPFIKNYSPRDYKATPQNLGISEDKNGVLYFANAAGVLEFNGKNWKLHKIPDNAAISCLHVAKDNNIYVGAYNEFGFFEKEENGELIYHSLKPKVKEDIENIVSINELNGEILFQTRRGFYKTRGRKVEFIKAPAAIHIAHKSDNRIYIKVKDKGIFEFNGKEFFPIKFADTFAHDQIYGVVRTKKDIIVATETSVYVSTYDQPFQQKELPFTNFNSLKLLNDKYLSFGLFGDGLVITDLEFNIIHQLNIDNGLQDGTINDQFLDNEKNLWVALNRGITKIEAFSPVTNFGFNQGIKSSVESVKQFKNEIYISTYNGLFYLDQTSKKFQPINNLKVDCYGLNDFIFNGDTSLFVAANTGLYSIDNRIANKIIDCDPFSFSQSKYYQNRIFICNYDGFYSYSYLNGDWKKENIDYKINWPVIQFCEENDKTIWVSDLNEGVYRLTIQPSFSEKVKIKEFTKNELPKGFVFVYNYNNRILFGTSNGLYEFNEKTNSFNRSSINPPFKEKFAIHRISSDTKGNLWLSVFYEKNAEYDVCYYNGKNWVYQPFQKSSNDIVQCFGFDKEFAYFGSASGLFCYDYSKDINYNAPYNTYIDQFLAGGNKQTISYTGDNFPVLEYALNDVVFQFFSNSYTDENATTFSFYLDGYSKKWSSWSYENQANFTNLHEGDYTFKVKSKNIFGIESPEREFHFTVLAPWYRKWYAYIMYVILFGAFVYGAILFSTRSLKNIIKERTQEVVHQKEEIEKQALVLEEKNRDILDSIKYAKRIQETIIPSEDNLKKAISKELFVFYKPKDIVSGDFYWMRQFNEITLLAVIDCTGHGVPGALVSIVGNNGLNRAVNEFGLRKPSDILDKLSMLTEEAFKQSGKEELRDGMDITLIAYNTTTRELQYAGANNPLWIIKEGQECVEIKANKQPIGKFEARQPFQNHSLQINTNDSVFLFTDGYADQFGGNNGKKFKYKQLQDLLQNNNHKPFTEVKSILVDAFEKWKSDYEQVDDVCLIGVKFI